MTTETLSTIWTGTGGAVGVTLKMELKHTGGKLSLSGTASGHGHTFNIPPQEVNGNTNWEGIVGRVGTTPVHGAFRITDWVRTPTAVRFGLRVWGAYGNGPWLPPGGYFFAVTGSLKALTSVAELAAALADLPKLDFPQSVAAEPPAVPVA